jgi:hypothetical protein
MRQLGQVGLRRITIIDDGSTYLPMLKLLSELEGSAEILRNKTRKGPRHLLADERLFRLLPDCFCVTDPDLAFNPLLPEDFLAQLIGLTAKYRIGKAGFAIDISEPERLKQNDFRIQGKHWKIWEWEKQFWQRPLDLLNSGDPVFAADVDTTFAVYNKAFFVPTEPLRGVRVAGNYTCQHLPWYLESIVPEEEVAFYSRSSLVYGNYHRESADYALGLLLDIYYNRPDLQEAFPEVSGGDYLRLLKWGCGVCAGAWEDSSYSMLAPYAAWIASLGRTTAEKQQGISDSASNTT